MDIYKDYRELVQAALLALTRDGVLPNDLDLSRSVVEAPRDPAHGDMSANATMVLAKAAGMKPRDLAEKLVIKITEGAGRRVQDIAIAGPGFINWRVPTDAWHQVVTSILQEGAAYGDSDIGAGVKLNVEYVSANPTGPLTVGHARGAIFGDALAALMAKAGYEVTKEYYINDAGTQVDVLARSTHLRYREALGEEIGDIPEGHYPGEYLKDVGQALAKRDGDKWLGVDETIWLDPVRSFAIDFLMDIVREDLKALGVEQEVFTSERHLVAQKAVESCLAELESKGLIYVGVLEAPKGKEPEDWEPRPQTLFKSSAFGDSVDRPVKKSDGSWTYFAADMGNHRDKIKRGFTRMIDVWGADHGGYVTRMKAAVVALSEGQASLDVCLCQMVKLLKGGEQVKMSKRAGTFVTLRDLIEEVGKDVVRFIMLTRKNDAPLDFDLDKALEQSRDNPVFYVQYAHARCRSVLRNAAEVMPESDLSAAALAAVSLDSLTDSDELGLIKKLAEWPRLVEAAAEAREPHRVAFYLFDVAAAFHGLWNKGKDETTLRFIQEDKQELTLARLALVQATATVIACGLSVMGVTPVEEMR